MAIDTVVNLSMQSSQRGNEWFDRRVFLESLRFEPKDVICAGAWLLKEGVDNFNFRLSIGCRQSRKLLDIFFNHAAVLPILGRGGAGMMSPHRLQVRSISSLANF